MTITYTIQEKYSTLTKSEKKIADYILSSGEKIVYNTMSDIREATNVGDGTIIRFCQKIGFSGFSDLKIAIAKEDFSKHQEESQPSDLFDQRTKTINSALKATNQLLDSEKLKQAVQFITEAHQIYIFGVGSSGNSGNDLEAMFLRVGVQSRSIIDPHFQAQVASLLTEKDLVIGFSLSGRTKDTYASLNVAKKNKAKVIAITNYQLSPIAQLADVVLQTAIEEFLDGASLAGKISQLYLCDLLIQSYEIENNVDSIELRETVLRSILDKGLD
ncbi:MAG: MurR/RpiR family transcriptional regulator [Enterococcus viikkiensis]|uniref:MurR/RpiR family transcriptional regulator n=1 Tax=Enterococcus viikkiensis TaxID=930854 RepID=A0ABU3FMH7_9ENTE|nr:MurR/RpiR family transcriptional regulator [Enterococcus viikkiensis]MDT2827175.1 MurR/RpiR family transcriptional regulator [Enterococcus viikkiensis]